MDKIKNFLFINSGIRQTIVKNTFWAAIGTTLSKIIRVGIIIYVARILGTSDYGIFTYAMSLIAIFAVFSDIGLTSILIRELSKRTEGKKEYLSTALAVKLFFLIGTLVLIGIFAPLISQFEQAKPLIFILGIMIVLESLRSFFYAIVRSENKMETEAGISIVTEIFTTIIILLTFLKYSSPIALAWAFLIGNTIGLLITIFSLRKYLVNIFGHFKKELIKPIIKSSWPFAILGISGIFMTNIDSVIIGIFNNPHALGLYAAAQRPISLLYILPSFLAAGLLPIISKFIQNREKERLSLVLEKSLLMSLAMALPLVVGGIIMAGPIINVTFGYDFIAAVLTFQILLFSLLIVFPGTILADLILAEDKQKVFIKSSLLGSATNVVLDLLLIPSFGIAGSAIATVIAQLVINGMLFIEIRKNIKFSLLSKVKKIFLSTIVMAAITYTLKLFSVPLILILIIAALIYFGLLIIMKDQIVEDLKDSLYPKTKIVS